MINTSRWPCWDRPYPTSSFGIFILSFPGNYGVVSIRVRSFLFDLYAAFASVFKFRVGASKSQIRISFFALALLLQLFKVYLQLVKWVKGSGYRPVRVGRHLFIILLPFVELQLFMFIDPPMTIFSAGFRWELNWKMGIVISSPGNCIGLRPVVKMSVLLDDEFLFGSKQL